MKNNVSVLQAPRRSSSRNRLGPPRRGLSKPPVMHCKSKWPAVVSCLLFFLSSATAQTIIRAPSPTPLPSRPPPLPSPSPTAPSTSATDEVIPVVITYGDGTEARVQIVRGIMEPVGIPAKKPVTVSLFLGSGVPGTPVALGLFDGGAFAPAAPPPTLPPMLIDPGATYPAPITIVDADRAVRFNFQSGLTLGLYRALVTVGPKEYLLRFYAVRPRAPSEIVIISPPPGPSPPNTPPPQ